MGSRLKREQASTCVATVSMMVFSAVRPSPVADTTILVEPETAPGAAVSSSDALSVLALEAGASGSADQAAVTPLGKPLTEKLMLPANDPPLMAVK